MSMIVKIFLFLEVVEPGDCNWKTYPIHSNIGASPFDFLSLENSATPM